MDVVTDLHLHSRYSRAVSKDMNLHTMASYARKKGFQLLSTCDWTHPLWLKEIKSQLEETGEGIFRIKNLPGGRQGQEVRSKDENKPVYFMLAVEISSIYSQGGKVRRIHNLILSPSFETSEKINAELLRRGCNLSSDGRPIIGISSRNLLELILEIDERAMLIPAHIWTPWFSLYGSFSGFDSIEECFGDMSPYVYGIETGLSSDPEMNWQIEELESRAILSFSDAHSPAKMGREATVFRLESMSYENVRKAIMHQTLKMDDGKLKVGLSSNHVLYTIEFYPEEGKYHYNGHRNCKVIETPDETREKGTLCPVCKRKITVGVMQRVEVLANELVRGIGKENPQGVTWITDPKGIHPPFVRMVPLNEIIAESYGMQVGAGKVKKMFDTLCDAFSDEIEVLLKAPIASIAAAADDRIAEGIKKVRGGDIVIRPGFDGEYGIVKIWSEGDIVGNGFKPFQEERQLGIDF